MGELVFTFKALAKAALFTPGCVLILAALAAFLARRGRRRLAKGAAGLAFALLALTSSPILVGIFADWVEGAPAYLDPAAPPPEVGAIVLLGGGVAHGDDAFGADVVAGNGMRRTHYAAVLHRRGGAPILVTGAGPVGGVGRGEAQAMAAFLAELGARARWVEDRSRDTADNARLSRAILKPLGIDRILLVTSAFHMRRAALAFEQVGFTVTPAPVGGGEGGRAWRRLVPSADAMSDFNTMLNELLGRLVYQAAAALAW